MLLFMLALFISIAASLSSPPPTSSTCLTPVINTNTPIFTTDPFFASWTIDPSRNRVFFAMNFSDSRLLYLASQIGDGNVLRFGGGGGDELTYGVPMSCDSPRPAFEYECLNRTTLDSLLALSIAVSSRLVFALNIHPLGKPSPPIAAWDPTAARGVLRYIRDSGVTLEGIELGNELNHHNFTASQQAEAFGVLFSLIEELWPTSSQKPRLWGPDADGAGATGSSSLSGLTHYLADFAGNMSAANIPLGVLTHHEYIMMTSDTVLNATALDASAFNAVAIVAAVRKVNENVPVWAGEIAPHIGSSNGNTTNTGNCSNNKLCGRFGSVIWYADAMGAKSRAGVAGFARQDLVGASYALINTSLLGEPDTAVGDFTPSPDYYLLYLWQRLVGARVLDVTIQGGGRSVRAYAFCTRGTNSSATLVLINIGASSVCVGIPSFVPSGMNLTVFSLTAGDSTQGIESWDIQLNGKILSLQENGMLPDLRGANLSGASVTLESTSVTIVVAPVGDGTLPACV